MSIDKQKKRKRGVSVQRFKRLNQQQQSFVEHLLADPSFNATKAARAAGYGAASRAAQRLMSQPVVTAAIGKAITERSEELQFEAKDVMAQLQAIINFDVSELYDDTGQISMEMIKALPPIKRKCIQNIKAHRRIGLNDQTGERETFYTYDVVLMSKDHALTMAMRHFGMMDPEVNINVISPEMKQQVVIQLLGQVQDDGIVDAKRIDQLAQEA